MLEWAKFTSLCFILSACATTPGGTALKPNTIVRGVDSGVLQVVDDYYSVTPDCGNMGYPEIKILNVPGHGTVAVKMARTIPLLQKTMFATNATKRRSPPVGCCINPIRDFMERISLRFKCAT